MLFKLSLEYGDGRCETEILYVEPGQQVRIQPQLDDIVFCGSKRFRYEVKKHPYLCKAIVRFRDKTFIYPEVIECHPKTTLDDIVEIDEKGETVEETIIKVVKPKPIIKEWKFESSSGGGTYVVTETKPGVYRCNCMGFFRAKGNCKHVKEVRGN